MGGSANQLLDVGDCSLEPFEYNKSHSADQKCKIGILFQFPLLCLFLKETQYTTTYLNFNTYSLNLSVLLLKK